MMVSQELRHCFLVIRGITNQVVMVIVDGIDCL